MKVCTECGTEKPLSDFPIRKRNGKEFLHSYCRQCKRARDNKAAKEPKRKAAIRMSAATRSAREGEYLTLSLVGQCCVNCSGTNQLRYHQTTDNYTADVLAAGNYSRSRIVSAINESIILCDVCQGKAYHYGAIFCQASAYGAKQVQKHLRIVQWDQPNILVEAAE